MSRDSSSRRTSAIAPSVPDIVSSAGGVPRRSTSRELEMGFPILGPSPFTKSRSSPMPTSGGRMSEKTIAASTPNASTGMSVTCAASSGVRITSSIACRSRSARYSGMYRPAWRSSQTGVRSAGSPWHARRNGDVGSATSRCDVPPTPSVSAPPSCAGEPGVSEMTSNALSGGPAIKKRLDASSYSPPNARSTGAKAIYARTNGECPT